MGNKQSGVSLVSQQHLAEPTSRSYSWQPDPLHGGEPVKRGRSFTGSGVFPGEHSAANIGSATLQRGVSYSSALVPAGVYGPTQGSSPNLAISNGNGSVVRGDAAFGGVQKEMPRSALKNNGTLPSTKIHNGINTADSGYMTEIIPYDSDKSARAKLRGSRLSLNDAMLSGTEFGPHQTPQPAMFHPSALAPIGHHFVAMPAHPGMIPLPPPPGAVGFFPPPEGFMLPPPMLNARPIPMDEKKAKKLRKKQQKHQQQQLSRQSSMLDPGEFIPPPGTFSLIPAPMIAYPPAQLAEMRSRSIDNFMHAGLIPHTAIIAPPPPPGPPGLPVRRYNSHIDISGMGQQGYHSATLQPGMGSGSKAHMATEDIRLGLGKKERKYEKRKDQQAGSLRDSPMNSSTLGRIPDSAFENRKNKNHLETSSNIENQHEMDSKRKSIDENFSSPKSQKGHSDSASNKHHRSEVIYETLKGTQKVIMATGGEINKISVNANSLDREGDKNKLTQDSPPPPTPKPIVITPEAKAILERNARILIEAENEKQQNTEIKENINKETQPFEVDKKMQSQNPIIISKMVEDLRKVPTPPPPPPTPPSFSQYKEQKEEIISKMNIVLKAHTQDNIDANKDIKQKAEPKEDHTVDTHKYTIVKDENHTVDAQRHTVARQNENVRKSSNTPENQTMPSSMENQIVNQNKNNDQISKNMHNENQSTSSDRDDIESLIEAILNPVLPRRKFKKPKDFEPLDAWRGINVQQELVKRQPQRMAFENGNGRDQQQSNVEERIHVRLVPCPPGRREPHGEPIYLEYDERLPEFKKRLIETGSFEIPEVDKFNHRTESQASMGSRRLSPNRWDAQNSMPDRQRSSQPQLWRDYVAMEEANVGVNTQNNGSIRSRKTIDSNKGSLKRLKESVANIFRAKSSDHLKSEKLSTTTDELPPLFPAPINNRYAPSLTPSISKIKAGDSSDIDFSWVHDLETRFRLEREQFERELQTLKQKSATLQRNDYMLSPKLHRQQSNQHVINSELDGPTSSTLKRVPSCGDHQIFYQQQNREKHFSTNANMISAQTPPPPGRMGAYHSQNTINDNNVSSNKLMDQQSKSRYFGIYDTTSGLVNQQNEINSNKEPYVHKELQRMSSANVRQKAALFESENQRVQREMDERNQQLAKKQRLANESNHRIVQQQPYRMGLQPQRSTDMEEPIYIPKPDYDENTTNNNLSNRSTNYHNHQNSLGRMNSVESGTMDFSTPSSGNRYKSALKPENDRSFTSPYMSEPLIVNTASNTGMQHRPNYATSPRSPSERRLQRYYNSNSNINVSLSPTNRNNAISGNRYESQPIIGSSNTLGRYSPSPRSPRMLRAQQQNMHLSVSNGFDIGVQNQMTMMKGNRVGQRLPPNGIRGVAFSNE